MKHPPEPVPGVKRASRMIGRLRPPACQLAVGGHLSEELIGARLVIEKELHLLIHPDDAQRCSSFGDLRTTDPRDGRKRILRIVLTALWSTPHEGKFAAWSNQLPMEGSGSAGTQATRVDPRRSLPPHFRSAGIVDFVAVHTSRAVAEMFTRLRDSIAGYRCQSQRRDSHPRARKSGLKESDGAMKSFSNLLWRGILALGSAQPFAGAAGLRPSDVIGHLPSHRDLASSRRASAAFFC
jgi:hypothetical protein